MSLNLTIVTHHYVRDVESSKESRVAMYNIGVSDFIKRLDYLIDNYTIITPDMFIDSIKYKTPLPANSMLLTFDDGYIDHYKNVFPILMDRGVKAFFFPSAMPIFEGRLLNTNKLQIIMDSTPKEILFNEAIKAVKSIGNGFNTNISEALADTDSTFEKQDILSAYLEWEIPTDLSNKIIDFLFRKLVGLNDKDLIKNYYMSVEQLQHMKENGMHIGCHGYNHYCMGYLPNKIKHDEIIKSLRLMKMINGSKREWVMCYPYGSFDKSLVSIIKSYGCIAGFTTTDDNSNIHTDELFKLSRIDISSPEFAVN